MNYYSIDQMKGNELNYGHYVEIELSKLSENDDEDGTKILSFSEWMEENATPSLTLPAPGEPWTPETVQLLCAAKGFSYIAMSGTEQWKAFQDRPTPKEQHGAKYWKSDLEAMEIDFPIAYSGDWRDSLRGPKT